MPGFCFSTSTSVTRASATHGKAKLKHDIMQARLQWQNSSIHWAWLFSSVDFMLEFGPPVPIRFTGVLSVPTVFFECRQNACNFSLATVELHMAMVVQHSWQAFSAGKLPPTLLNCHGATSIIIVCAGCSPSEFGTCRVTCTSIDEALRRGCLFATIQ